MIYKYKHCPLSAELHVKDIDEANRKVDIIVSAMGVKDSDGDVIYDNAFNKSISDWRSQVAAKGKGRIAHLLQHKPTDVIGRPIEMKVEDNKLRVISEISKSTKGKDAIEDYKLNLYEHSIGFRIIDGEQKEDYYGIKEVGLWEYSSVTWGANENTPLNGIKSLIKANPTEAISKAEWRMNVIAKALAKGDYTDERFEALEIELKQIQQLYRDIIDSLSKPEPVQTTEEKQEKPKPEIQVNLLETFYAGFKSL